MDKSRSTAGARAARPEPSGHPAKPGAGKVQGEKKNRRGMRTWQKVVLITLAVILLLASAVLIWYKNWAKLPDIPDLPNPPSAASPTIDPVTGNTVQPVASNRKEGFYTFLLVGRDTGGGGNTDTMMLASYDIPNQKVSVMSVPRDTLVDARHPGKNRKMNAVYNLGKHFAEEGDDREGIDYLKEAFGDMMGYTPDFYVIVNWQAFGRLVDAIGGVDFEVPFDMKYKDPTQDLVIDQPGGFRHLSGSDAMEIVRWRHNNDYSVQYKDADLGRIRTQQALLTAIIKECLQIKNVTKISEFAEIFVEEVDTDLSLGNLVAFGERAILGGLSVENVEFLTLPCDGVYIGSASYVQARPEELLALLNEKFSPYVDPLEIADLSVAGYDGSKIYVTGTKKF